MSTEHPAPRRRWSRTPDDGPRATVRQLLPYLTEHRAVLSVVVLLSLLGAAASLAQPLLVSQLLSAVTDGRAYNTFVAGLVTLVVATGLLSGFQHYLLQRIGEGVVLSSRKRLVARMLRLPIAEYDRRRTGDLVSRVGSDTTLLRAVLTQGLVEAVGGAATFVGAIVAMAVIDPVLLLLTVVVVAVAVATVVSLSERIRTASRQAQEKVGDLAAAVERALGAVRTIRAANATDREIAVIEAEAEGAWRMGIRVAQISAFIVPVAGISMQVCFLVVLGVGGFRVASGAITIAQLVAFILFLFLMIMPLGQAFGAITSVNQALGALGRIQEIISIPSESDDDERIAEGAFPPDSSDAAVELVDVSFDYPSPSGDERSPGGVLDQVSFRAERGRCTALVGPSGAGKSTVLALLERFYDPDVGVVRVNGRDVRSMAREELRATFGYVEQDAPVLAGSLRDNLLIARPDATDADCRRVLGDVNLVEVLGRSPLGLGAPVGEEGVMLSGGERQRLAIARALLAAAPILLLDESTSSLDGLNEQLLRDAIDAVAEQRTLIVIAHRLSTVVDADTIVVLDHGRVVGIGTHCELVASTPLYRALAQHQLLVRSPPPVAASTGTSPQDPGFSRPLVPTPSSLTHAQHQAIQEHLADTTAFGGLRLHDGGLVANYATTPIDPASRVAIDQAREIYSLTVTCLQYTATQLQTAIRELTAPSTRTRTAILLYILAPLASGAGLEIRVAEGTGAACAPDGPSLLAQLDPSVPVIITEGSAPVAG